MRDRIEAALGRWGRFVYRRAPWVIAAVLIATGGLASELRHFYLDATSEGFFHSDDPIRVQYDAFREAFGRETMILVALRPDGGVFQQGFLERLRTIHEQIEDEVPFLVEVTSLVNARDTRGFEDRLEVGDFLAEWPETQEDLMERRARAEAIPIFENYLLSPDGTLTTIVIETQAYVFDEEDDVLAGFEADAAESGDVEKEARPLGASEDLLVTTALYEVLDRHRNSGLEISVAGPPIFTTELSRHISGDIGRFTGLSVVIVALFLALLFRRVGAVVVTLLTVILTVVATLSLMATTGVPLMPPTQIIPSFLLAVGVGGAVHLLAIFYQARRRGDDEESAVVYTLSHSGLPIIMAALTTAAGLLSFIPAALRPISHFGIFTPAGVLVSLFFTLTLLPAMIAVLPMGVAEARGDDTFSQRMLLRIGSWSIQHAVAVMLIWAGVLVVAATGLPKIQLGHHMLEWFPESDPIYIDSELLNRDLGGAVSFELLVDTAQKNGFKNPDFLRNLDAAQQFVLQFEHEGLRAGKTLALTDVVKETHRALNENRQSFYAIPDEQALVSQELLLFENAGSDDVEKFVDSQFGSGRVTVRVPMVDGARYNPYLDALLPELERILGPDVQITVTGLLRLLGNTVTAALQTMIRSYISAFIVITVLMVLLIGRLGMGLVAMIPNLSPIVFTLGLMGWLGIPLDMFTLLIGTIAIGLAVDDTIHFMHNFRRSLEDTGDPHLAVRRTLQGAGQAMLFTTLVLVSGFLVYTQAYMDNLFAFGTLTATAIAVAFVADVTLAPALVTTLSRRGGAKRDSARPQASGEVDRPSPS
ncbi:MAG: hypothetical protein CL908_13940 [Deltaproteobacteria bacterium]|nr:hypothetical protein [Deltaproteobacteria bacterium]